MTIQATVLLKKNEFLAELSDGRRLAHGQLSGLAEALHRAGVLTADTQCDWRSGHRMLTAGQQVALTAEMRRLEKQASRTRVVEPVFKPARGFALVA